MGGPCSMLPAGKTKVEACLSLDVNQLHRDGCLRDGARSVWKWNCGGKHEAVISTLATATAIVLSYQVGTRGSDPEVIEEGVGLVYVPCRYGGARPYFTCPGVVDGISCNRRVAKLYLKDRYFLCRNCLRLGYASQREDRYDRALRRARKIRTRLEGKLGAAIRFPRKPKGMWWRTYQRLRERTFEAETLADEAFR